MKCDECNKRINKPKLELNVAISKIFIFPLRFCDWDCLMAYVIKKHNREMSGIATIPLKEE